MTIERTRWIRNKERRQPVREDRLFYLGNADKRETLCRFMAGAQGPFRQNRFSVQNLQIMKPRRTAERREFEKCRNTNQ